MAKEFTTSKTPDITVRTKIIFSKPLSDLYMLKELFNVDDKPEDFDCIKTRTIKRPEIINCNVFVNASIITFFYKDFLKINKSHLS